MSNLKDNAKIKVESLQINEEEWAAVDQITGDGLNTIATKLGSNTAEESWMPFIAIGDGLPLPSSEDKVLASEIHRKRGIVTIINNTYFIEATFGKDEPTADCWIREVGIFDAVTGGKMGARWLLVDEVWKEYDEEIYIKIAISILIG
jgi:hypothetical protein